MDIQRVVIFDVSLFGPYVREWIYQTREDAHIMYPCLSVILVYPQARDRANSPQHQPRPAISLRNLWGKCYLYIRANRRIIFLTNNIVWPSERLAHLR
jgi:hypothetical protein